MILAVSSSSVGKTALAASVVGRFLAEADEAGELLWSGASDLLDRVGVGRVDARVAISAGTSTCRVEWGSGRSLGNE